VTELDHHSNIIPWQLLAEEKGARLEAVRIDADGRLDLDHLQALLREKPKLVAVPHVSNALGTINPVAEIIALAHEAGAVVMVDGAQSVPHMPVDVQALDADFLALSGHKTLGPMGSGALYGKLALLEAMPPFMGGGGMIRKVSFGKSTWADVPARFEAGTPSVGDAIGLGAAVDYLDGIGMANVQEHERQLTSLALERLATVPGLRLYGPPDAADHAGVISFTLGDVHPHDVAAILNEENVAVRAGHHCCQPLMERLELPATTRASFYVYNDEADVEQLVEGLQRANAIFGA
ncbi:MAG: cysteine desulfurase, partial [Thermomicrobiales bacterium]